MLNVESSNMSYAVFNCVSKHQNQTNYLPIRLLSHSQTVVKPNESNCLITFDTPLTTSLTSAHHFKKHSATAGKQFVYSRGFIKGQAPGKLTGCERDLAINLPGCLRLLFLLSFISKTKNAHLKTPTDLLHKNLMKPLLFYARYFKDISGSRYRACVKPSPLPFASA